MTHTLKISAALLPIVTMLAACSAEPETPKQTGAQAQPAHHYYLNDTSVSTATQIDPAVARAVERFIGADMNANVQLGDSVTVYETGARSAERMVAKLHLVTDYAQRVPVAKSKVMEALRASAARVQQEGGDGDTNLLLTAEAIPFNCTPRSTITFITDGVESGDYSAGEALASGAPVNLPPPSSDTLLAACKIRFVGFGLTVNPATGDAELLPAKPLAALRAGWVAYMQAAGVRPEDIEFISTL